MRLASRARGTRRHVMPPFPPTHTIPPPPPSPPTARNTTSQQQPLSYQSRIRYETASTRLFKRGRTETIRSCTSEAALLSAAVCARNYDVTQPMRDTYLYMLLQQALSKHKQLTQEAMAGQVSVMPAI